MDEVKKILAKLESTKPNVTEDEAKKYEKLKNIMRRMDLSVLTAEGSTTLGSKKKKIKSYPQKPTEELLLETHLEDTERQINLVNQALGTIYELQNSRFTKMISKRDDNARGVLNTRTLIDRIIARGRRIPLWIGKPNQKPPPLCGRMEADPDYVPKVGDFVAAFIGKKRKNWVLSEIISYNSENQTYTVDDIFEASKAEHVINSDEIIPLPAYRAHPDLHPEALFPPQSIVLALYPQTTCFYRGIIFEKPKTAKDPYQVLFEDCRFECNYAPPSPVDQCYVLQNKSTSAACIVPNKRSRRLHSKEDTSTTATESEED